MNRSRLRVVLFVALLLSAAFAAWTWFRPYEWAPDEGARGKLAACQVRRDGAYYWIDLHFKVASGTTHDLEKPVRLIAADGREVEMADITFGSQTGHETTELWLKFWVDEGVAAGPMKLRINDGFLTIRSGSGAPPLGFSQSAFFASHRW